MADALVCCKKLGIEIFQDCMPTVIFLKHFNDGFDILNSRNSYVKGYKKAISEENGSIIIQRIEEIQKYILSLKTITQQPIYTTKSQTGFISFYIGLEIVKDIYTNLIKTQKITTYETYSSCQDHLEIFFSAIRSRNGWCTSPSVLQFKSALRSLIVHAQTRYNNKGNCEEIECLPILQSIKNDQRNRLGRASLFKSKKVIELNDEGMAFILFRLIDGIS